MKANQNHPLGWTPGVKHEDVIVIVIGPLESKMRMRNEDGGDENGLTRVDSRCHRYKNKNTDVIILVLFAVMLMVQTLSLSGHSTRLTNPKNKKTSLSIILE